MSFCVRASVSRGELTDGSTVIEKRVKKMQFFLSTFDSLSRTQKTTTTRERKKIASFHKYYERQHRQRPLYRDFFFLFRLEKKKTRTTKKHRLFVRVFAKRNDNNTTFNRKKKI